MQYKKDIQKALKDFEIRKKSYMLDMVEYVPNGVKYNTELIRNLEVIDAQIYTLKWVLLAKQKIKAEI